MLLHATPVLWVSVGGARRHYIVHSGNLREVRGYNRLVRMASSDVVALLQDDDIPPKGEAPAYVRVCSLRRVGCLATPHLDNKTCFAQSRGGGLTGVGARVRRQSRSL